MFSSHFLTKNLAPSFLIAAHIHSASFVRPKRSYRKSATRSWAPIALFTPPSPKIQLPEFPAGCVPDNLAGARFARSIENDVDDDVPGSSPRNGPPAASPAARASGIGRCTARYSSSSAKPSPCCLTSSVRARSRSRRRSARCDRAASWRTAYPSVSTRSTTADTPSQAWWVRRIDHRWAVPAEAATTAASRSPRGATCRRRTRGRKPATPPAAPLA